MPYIRSPIELRSVTAHMLQGADLIAMNLRDLLESVERMLFNNYDHFRNPLTKHMALSSHELLELYFSIHEALVSVRQIIEAHRSQLRLVDHFLEGLMWPGCESDEVSEFYDVFGEDGDEVGN
ncbi:uncharacterized protein LAJ45_01139 [Morchella importuna]|uniref:uncharacterized protein n=1 Tax=Morchella importuna TaxID=1174673 RepID=UPI001E8D5070|nr:uncharacterized protein LAJ45_01139 [Morchella importuna]KAH8154611.1 hypothetical protein LAJ45_01139 [Morchella importuna]